jgi:putative inorganic carbon (HCO3(-)) transporter
MTMDERAAVATGLERATVWFRDAAIAAALLAAPLMWGRFQSSGLALTFCLAAAAGLAYLIAALFARREITFLRTPLNLPIALLLVIALISTLVASVNRYQSSLEFYKLLSCASLFWLIANQPATPWRRRLYLGAVVAGALITSWLGAREYVVERVIGKNPSYRIFGTFFNPNELAGFLELVIPLALAAFLSCRSAAMFIITGFAALLPTAALLLTASRGGWLGLAGAMFVFALLAGAAFRRTRLAVAAGVVVLGVIVLVALAVPPLRARLLSGGGEHSSNMFRYLTWRGAMTMAADHPWLGVGPDAFEFIYPRYAVGGFTRMAHENYLQVTAETGVPGGIAFVWMLGAFFWLAGKGFRRLRERESRLLCAACIAGVFAFCIHSLLDYGWYIGAIALTVFALFGLATNAGAPEPLTPEPERPRRSRGKPAKPAAPMPTETGIWQMWHRPLPLTHAGAWSVMIIVTAVAALAAAHPVRAYVAATYHERGRTAESGGNRIVAEQSYREAVRLAPGDGEYHRQLARMKGVPSGIDDIKRAIQLEPTNALNYLVLAKMYEITGPWDEAAANYQRAIELYPNYLAAYRGLADLEARRGRIETALSLYRRMVDIEHSPYERYKALEQRVEPEYAYAHYALGRAALERGDAQEAGRELGLALDVLRRREIESGGIIAAMRAAGEFSLSAEQQLAELKARILWRLAELTAQSGDAVKADSLRVEARQLAPDVERVIEQEPSLVKGASK